MVSLSYETESMFVLFELQAHAADVQIHANSLYVLVNKTLLQYDLVEMKSVVLNRTWAENVSLFSVLDNSVLWITDSHVANSTHLLCPVPALGDLRQIAGVNSLLHFSFDGVVTAMSIETCQFQTQALNNTGRLFIYSEASAMQYATLLLPATRLRFAIYQTLTTCRTCINIYRCMPCTKKAHERQYYSESCTHSNHSRRAYTLRKLEPAPAAPQEQPEEVPQEQPEGAPQEQPEEVTQEQPEEAPQEQPTTGSRRSMPSTETEDINWNLVTQYLQQLNIEPAKKQSRFHVPSEQEAERVSRLLMIIIGVAVSGTLVAIVITAVIVVVNTQQRKAKRRRQT
jgi:hypothetical protein